MKAVLHIKFDKYKDVRIDILEIKKEYLMVIRLFDEQIVIERFINISRDNKNKEIIIV